MNVFGRTLIGATLLLIPAACGSTKSSVTNGSSASTASAATATGNTTAVTSGSSSSGGSEKDFVDALAASIQGDESFPIDPDQAKCLATAMVKVIGVDALVKAGVSPADIASGKDVGTLTSLSEKQATAMANVIFDGKCVDFSKLMTKQLAQGLGGSLTDAQVTCVAEALFGNDLFKKAVIDSMTGNTAVDMNNAFGDIFSLLSKCKISLGDLSS
jgi:hypothetical protein